MKGTVVEYLPPANTELALAVEVAWPVLGRVASCPTCGDLLESAGLTVKCRDAHVVCNQCFAPFDQPKAAGCRRRKHPKTPAAEEKKEHHA